MGLLEARGSLSINSFEGHRFSVMPVGSDEEQSFTLRIDRDYRFGRPALSTPM
jgi:hypothetical protein